MVRETAAATANGGVKLVGRHGYDTFTDPTVTVVGDQAGIDYEALLRAQPTHVLTQWGKRDPPARLAELARQRGFTVQDFPLLTLDDVVSAARAVETLVAARPTLSSRLSEAFAPREPVNGVGPVLLLYALSPPTALGPGSFHHQLLERAGGTPALAEGAPFIALDAEDVRRLRPSAVLVIRPRPANTTPAPDAPAGTEATAEVAAEVAAACALWGINPSRVSIINDPESAIPGPGLIRLAAKVRARLEEWAGAHQRQP
jgi:ABC-type hemin transport system substrate-binding protein